MRYVGIVDKTGVEKDKKGKQYDWVRIRTDDGKLSRRFVCYNNAVDKANPRLGDKVRFDTWEKNDAFIDAMEIVPETTQTDLSPEPERDKPQVSSQEKKASNDGDDREHAIAEAVCLKAAATLFMGSCDVMTEDAHIEALVVRVLKARDLMMKIDGWT